MLWLQFVCSFINIFLKEKKLVPVTFSQCMSQVPSDLWGREFWVHPLPTFSFGVRINRQVKNYFHQHTLPVATAICNLRRQMPRFGVPGSHSHLTAQMCPPGFHLRVSFPALGVSFARPRRHLLLSKPAGNTLRLRTATLPSCAHTCSVAMDTSPNLSRCQETYLVQNWCYHMPHPPKDLSQRQTSKRY